MGLLDKLKTITGTIANKATSALGVFKQKAQGLSGIVSTAVALKQTKAAPAATPKPITGMAPTLANLSSITNSPVIRGTLAANQVMNITEKAINKVPRAPGAPAKADLKGSFTKTALATMGGLTLAGLTLAGAEKTAEKLGVRGGAGFIGTSPSEKKAPKKKGKRKTTRRRKAKSKKKARRTTRSRRTTLRRRVSFTTKDGRRVSFTPNRSKRRKSRRSRRSRSSISKREERSILREIRKAARR